MTAERHLDSLETSLHTRPLLILFNYSHDYEMHVTHDLQYISKLCVCLVCAAPSPLKLTPATKVQLL